MLRETDPPHRPTASDLKCTLDFWAQSLLCTPGSGCRREGGALGADINFSAGSLVVPGALSGRERPSGAERIT